MSRNRYNRTGNFPVGELVLTPKYIPGKHSDTKINPLTLTNGHGRYMAVTPEWTLFSVGEWPLHLTVINLFVTVSLLKRFRNGRFTSETAMRRFQKRNDHLDPETLKKIRWNF
jgi:hypothetical protein